MILKKILTNIVGPFPRDPLEIEVSDRRRVYLKNKELLPPSIILIRNAFDDTTPPRGARIIVPGKPLFQLPETKFETFLLSSDPATQEIPEEVRRHLGKRHLDLLQHLEKETRKRKRYAAGLEMRRVSSAVPRSHILRSLIVLGEFDFHVVADSQSS